MSTDLQHRLLAFIGGAADDFDALSLEVFAFQRERNAVYRAYCDRQPPVTHWKEIPAVPTSAFKDFAIACFPVAEAVAEFHTSGTTREQSGKHYFKTLELYDAASRPNFAAHLLPEGLPALVLTPSPAEAPHSSLVHMLDVVAGLDVEYFVEGDTLQVDRLSRRLRELQSINQPVLLLGTAFAFVNFFDTKPRFELPSRSRAMETGGFKGRSREVPKNELYGRFQTHLGIPPRQVVNEYGMTELSTQFYDETLRIGRQSDVKDVPPWARVLIIDPNTGKEAALGKPGMIRVFDLANLWSTMCVQTEDLGVSHKAGQFEIIGRASGAEVRGCSLNAESLKT